jgi:hypothetical protein
MPISLRLEELKRRAVRKIAKNSTAFRLGRFKNFMNQSFNLQLVFIIKTGIVPRRKDSAKDRPCSSPTSLGGSAELPAVSEYFAIASSWLFSVPV